MKDVNFINTVNNLIRIKKSKKQNGYKRINSR